MHHRFHADGGLPQSAGSSQDENFGVPAAGKEILPASGSRYNHIHDIAFSALPTEQLFPRHHRVGTFMATAMRNEFGHNSY